MNTNTMNQRLLVSQVSSNSDAGVTGLPNPKNFRAPAFKVNDMTKTFINLKQSYIYVGDNSRFQQRITWILSFQWIFYSMLVMISPIMFKYPKFECDLKGSGKYTSCQEETVCDIISSGVGKYKVLDEDQSIAAEFHLFCDQTDLVFYAQSIIFAGCFVAGLVSSWVSDRFGRRKSLLFSLIIGSSAAIAIGYSSNIYMVMGLTFLAGFGMNGYETIILVYCTEISERRFRDISVTVLQIMWALSQVLQPTISSLVKEWREIYIYAIGIPLLLSVALSYRFFPESPRYLASKQRYYESREVFRYISTINRRPPYEFHLHEEIEDYNSIATQIIDIHQQNQNPRQTQQFLHHNDHKRQTNILDLFKSRQIISITLIMCFFWFTRYFTYFSLLFSIKNFGDEIQKNFQILAIIEVLTALISSRYFLLFRSTLFIFDYQIKLVPLKLKLTRKKAMKSSLLMMSVFSCLTAIIDIPQECRLDGSYCISKETVFLFAILLKFSIVFFIVILMTYSSEVFPTVLRSQGQGVCMIVGSIGSSLAPLAQNFDFHPLYFTTCLGVVGYLCVMFLDENQNMKDFIQENNPSEQKQSQQQDIPLQIIVPKQ